MKGLRPRLVLTFALVAAVTAAALAVTSYVIVRKVVLDRATDAALGDSQARVAEAVARLPPGASPSEVRFLVTRLPDPAGAGVLVLGDDGNRDAVPPSLTEAMVPGSLASPPADRLSWVRTGTGRDGRIVVGTRVTDGPRLYLFFPLAGAIADLEVLRNVLAAVGAGLVLLSVGAGVLATRGLLLPLRRARHAANRLQVGILDTRLPEEGDDEFTDLARAFNRMADALERTVGDLRTMEARQRRFVSDVSHELRTPLTALTTAAGVLENNVEGLNDHGRRAARLLVVESRRLAGMVEDLMEISRFDAGVPVMAWEPVDVGLLVTGALETRGWTGRVGAVVAPSATTWADPRRLDTVVANLVGNALEHGDPPVTVSVATSGAGIAVTVDDAGPGIPADRVEQVFERFYKADPSRSRGGSGLGLAIARENARLHGGDITVQPAPSGRGSRFTFVLPRRSGPPQEEPPAGGREEPTARYEMRPT